MGEAVANINTLKAVAGSAPATLWALRMKVDT